MLSRWYPSLLRTPKPWAWILWILVHVLLAHWHIEHMLEILLRLIIATLPCLMTYIPCVLHPILRLLVTIICLVATMSFLHICHVPLLVTWLTLLTHTWCTISLSIVLSATPYARYAWIVLHLTRVFRHLIFFGVVNASYAYHRPLITHKYMRSIVASFDK